MRGKLKDPKKVAAGRKGGKASPTNFKRNKLGASMAGRRSAWMKSNGKLEDFPVGLIDPSGKEIPITDDPPEKRVA